LTRPVARQRAKALFDICAGFVYSQVLAASTELSVFEHLRDGALDIDVIARKTALPPSSALTLLRAGASLGLFDEISPARFAMGAGGAALLGNPGVMALIKHHTALYADLADPVRLLRDRPKDTALSAFWRYAVTEDRDRLTKADVSGYSELMAASQSFLAADVLGAFSFKRFTRLIDVGGGAGAFLAAALKRNPHLEGILFDLPAVAEIARARFALTDLNARVRIESGDFYRAELPKGADVASLVRVIHDHDDEAALSILRAVYAALPKNGALLVAEPLAGTAGAKAMGAAYFGVYLLAMGSGRPRTRSELLRLVQEAGFRDAQFKRTRRPLLVSVLVAKRE